MISAVWQPLLWKSLRSNMARSWAMVNNLLSLNIISLVAWIVVATFSSFLFSPSGNKLLYIAEKVKPKTKSYFDTQEGKSRACDISYSQKINFIFSYCRWRWSFLRWTSKQVLMTIVVHLLLGRWICVWRGLGWARGRDKEPCAFCFGLEHRNFLCCSYWGICWYFHGTGREIVEAWFYVRNDICVFRLFGVMTSWE